ncbi:MAG TPA: hypothetical protein VNO33_16300 [Kofleriaceae bacterium]|nr:hypothetical protein [Kofleriaceae bacterium]
MTTENEFFGSDDLRPPSEHPDGHADVGESSFAGASRSMMERPSPRMLVRAGLRAVRRFPWLVLILYLVQLGISAGAAAVMFLSLRQSFGHRPVFDRAMDGDVAAFIVSASGEPRALLGLVWIGVATVILYSVVSWFLTAGLIAVLLDAPSRRREVVRWFGAAGASNFFPFLRLALWSALPYAVVLVVAGVGFAWVEHRMEHAMAMGDFLQAVAIGLSPALLLHWLLATAIDYARVDLVRHPGMSSIRGLIRGFGLIARHRLALVHTLLYGVLFVGVMALYGWMTLDGAIASLVALFALRQLSGLIRFVAHVMLIAGQVELGCSAMGTPLGRRR